MQHTFPTAEPVQLHVELGRGRVEITTGELDETVVEVSGRHPEEVSVAQRGQQITVLGPRRGAGFLRGGQEAYVVAVRMPSGSGLTTRLGSADLAVRGEVAATRAVSGSGDVVLDTVTAAAEIQTGSGGVTIARLTADSTIKSGSGDVRVDHAAGRLAVSTGSGDVHVGRSDEATAVKTGSGDARVESSEGDLAFATGSGDLRVDLARRGQVNAKGASGDVAVGIPAGTPVWTDVTTITGRITSDLPQTGQPADGQDHVEVRATTVSGDIALITR